MTRFRTVKPLIVEAMQVKEPLEVNTATGKVYARQGEWLVRGHGGNYYVCSDTEFKCTFAHLGENSFVDSGSEGHECGC